MNIKFKKKSYQKEKLSKRFKYLLFQFDVGRKQKMEGNKRKGNKRIEGNTFFNLNTIVSSLFKLFFVFVGFKTLV